MLEHEPGLDNKETVIGRAGIKLPEFKWQPRDEPEYNFVEFFRKLWEVNGYACSTESRFRGRSYEKQAFAHELVVPAIAGKPPVFLRGSYSPRSSVDIDYSLRRNQEMSEWGQTAATTVGNEEYGLFLLPSELGPLLPLLKVSYTHSEGGSCGLSGPDNSVSLLWQGRVLQVEDHKPTGQNSYSNQAYEAARDAFEERLQEVWRQATELLV